MCIGIKNCLTYKPWYLFGFQVFWDAAQKPRVIFSKSHFGYINQVKKDLWEPIYHMVNRIMTPKFKYFITVILLKQTFQIAIHTVNGDRGSFVGCYQQNDQLKKLDIFSGSSDICINECEALYLR